MARTRARALPRDVRVKPWDGGDRLPYKLEKGLMPDLRRLNPPDFYDPPLRDAPGPKAGEHDLRDRTLVYEIVRIERELVSRGWTESEARTAARRDVGATFGLSDDVTSEALTKHRPEAEENIEAYRLHSSG